MTAALTSQLLSLSGWVVYLAVAGLAFAEAAIFVGFVLPGETAVVIGGVLASQHVVSLPAIMVVAICAAILGDSVGYEVGRVAGPRVLRARLLARHRDRLDRARRFLAERGGWAVFAGRWVAFLRAVMPGLAGMSRMPYPKFLAWNAFGGIVWASTFTLLGYVAGTSFEKVVSRFGLATGAAAVLLAAAVLAWHWRRSRRRDAEVTPVTGPGERPAAEQVAGDLRSGTGPRRRPDPGPGS